jgi:hypothetical protein
MRRRVGGGGVVVGEGFPPPSTSSPTFGGGAFRLSLTSEKSWRDDMLRVERERERGERVGWLVKGGRGKFKFDASNFPLKKATFTRI